MFHSLVLVSAKASNETKVCEGFTIMEKATHYQFKVRFDSDSGGGLVSIDS